MQVCDSQMSGNGEDCFFSGGRRVKCKDIGRLGKLMRKVYGKKASDIALVARDKSWDPTKVYNKEREAEEMRQSKVYSMGGRKQLREVLKDVHRP